MLYLYKRIIFGEMSNEKLIEILDLNNREKIILIPLAIAVIFIGIFPNIFMTIHPERLWIFGPKPHHSDPNKCSFTKWSFQIPSHQVRDESKIKILNLIYLKKGIIE